MHELLCFNTFWPESMIPVQPREKKCNRSTTVQTSGGAAAAVFEPLPDASLERSSGKMLYEWKLLADDIRPPG